MRALFVLTPAGSKRMIGKAVATLPEVKYAPKKDYLLMGHGSTDFIRPIPIMDPIGPSSARKPLKRA